MLKMWRGTSLSTLLHGSLLVLLLVGIPVVSFMMDESAPQGGAPGAQKEAPDGTEAENSSGEKSTVARQARPALPDWGLQQQQPEPQIMAEPNQRTTGPVAVISVEALPKDVQEKLKRLQENIAAKQAKNPVENERTGLTLTRPEQPAPSTSGPQTARTKTETPPAPDEKPTESAAAESTRDPAPQPSETLSVPADTEKSPQASAEDAKQESRAEAADRPEQKPDPDATPKPSEQNQRQRGRQPEDPVAEKPDEPRKRTARSGGGEFGAGGPGGTGEEGEGARGELSREQQRPAPPVALSPDKPVESVDALLQRLAEALPRVGRDAKFGVATDAPFEVNQRRAQNFQRMMRAAQYGHANAQYNVARMLIRGEGTKPDLEAAKKWLQKAAERNYERAQLLLGYIAAGGANNKRELGDADFWWALAERQGSKAAKEARKLLRPMLLSSDVLHSQRRQREYRRLFDFLPKPFRDVGGGEGISDELMEAAAAGDTKSLLKALLRGADVDGQDIDGKTAMINAAWRGRGEIIRILLDNGADLEVADNKNRTPVMWSAINGHEKVLDDLLVAGAEPDVPDVEGLTPLMRAAWNGHSKIVERLLLAGADPFRRDFKGRTALDHAKREGHADIVARLGAVKR